MKRIFLLLIASFSLSAQVTYSLNKNTVLSAAAEVITAQQPAANTSIARSVSFVSAYIDSTVAVVITLERNGTAATTTVLTPAQVNPQLATTATVQGFSSSNVGTGTVLGKYSIAANGFVNIDLSDIRMSGADSSQNLTIRTSSVSGTVNIIIKWREL